MLSLFLLTLAIQTPQAAPQVVTVAPNTTTSATAPGALPQPMREGERLICRTESVLGSNRRQRVCMTAEQRQQAREQSRELRERLDRPFNPAAAESNGGG